MARERVRSLGDEQAEHERSVGDAGAQREHRNSERPPRVAPEAPQAAHVNHDSALGAAARSPLANDQQRNTGPSR